MPTDLRSITDFDGLLAYLGSELDWPVEDYTREQLTFEYDADELGLKDEEAEKLKDGSIRQLRPMPGGQPFGIFFVEFGQAKLPVVVLRRILNALVIKKRNSANPADRQRWDAADLLFISAFGEDEDREIAFAHFHKDPNTSELPVLRVLGWDGADTTLKTQYVAETLKNRLHWPDDSGDHEAWRTQWRGAFRHRLGHVIKTSSDLADALASFASKIRDAATTIMAHESEAKGQLFKLLRGLGEDLRFHAVVADKMQLAARETKRREQDPKARYQKNSVYDGLIRELYGKFHRIADEFHIWIARRGKSDRNKALRTAIEHAEKDFEAKFGFRRDADWHINVSDPNATVCLQAVDYFLWAVQRFYERRESRFLDMMWPQIGEIHDLDHGKTGGTYFKGTDRPLLETAFPRKHEEKKKKPRI